VRKFSVKKGGSKTPDYFQGGWSCIEKKHGGERESLEDSGCCGFMGNRAENAGPRRTMRIGSPGGISKRGDPVTGSETLAKKKPKEGGVGCKRKSNPKGGQVEKIWDLK